MSEAAPAPARKRGPARTVDWDAILNRWAAGENYGDICRATRSSSSTVSRIVCTARRQGDERATVRRPPVRGANRGDSWARDYGLPAADPHYRRDPRQLALFPEAEA